MLQRALDRVDSGVAVKSFLSKGAGALFVALALGAIAATAQTAEEANRPATVPAGYVVTPFGYFHPSCIKQVSQGDVLQVDEGIIQHADGSYDTLAPCGHPHYNARGALIPSETSTEVQATNPTISNWVEAQGITTSSSFGELVASWSVPAAPTTTSDGQTVYLFPGMNDTATLGSPTGTIIQPVVAWNDPNFVNESNVWSIASWDCCYEGNSLHSTFMTVNPGNLILGTIKSNCSAGNESCSTWDIGTEDENSGESTTLASASSYGQTFNEAYAGALEVYGINTCSDYPPNGAAEFFNVSLYDDNFNVISNPAWQPVIYYTNETPQCDYNTEYTDQEGILSYGPPQAPAVSSQHSCVIFGGQEYCFDYVTMSDSNPAASIYYTTNGTTPTTSSSLYTGAVAYTPPTTFKAIAVFQSHESVVTTLVAGGGGPQ